MAMLTLDKVYHASYVLKNVIRTTDLIHAPNINPSGKVYLKTENLQVTGSFKVRGSYYKISQLTDEEKSHGVIACSAGNHAQGVALAATKNGIKSIICLPDGAPISKVEATKKYGAKVELVHGVYDDAYERALRLRDEKGYTFIHPFDDENVIAGQGTIGLELLDQLPEVDAVVVPVGGGGLIAGVAFAIKSLNPHVKVYGVQACGAASMVNALQKHQKETLSQVSTIADGIAVKTPGDLTYELCEKLIAEGAGAVSVAAVLFNKIPVEGRNVVCLVSGGNIDVTILSRVISRGLLKAGRSADITIELADKPGQLSGVSEIIAREGGNVVSVYHDRADLDTDINACYLRLVLETRDHAHVEQIKKALVDAGYTLIVKERTY